MNESELYLRVREKEGRLYADEVVRNLPEVPTNHPLKQEWQRRAESMRRLMHHVERQQRPMRILELGCGNGWLSHRLATLREVRVWGMDRLSSELAQAARVFGDSRTAFLAGDIWRAPFEAAAFDIAIIASAIQYFPDLRALVDRLCELVGPKGEVHIIDSPLYDEDDVELAQERTRAYYAALGFPEMASHYFHHTYAEMKQFSPQWLYRPDSFQARVSRSLGSATSPFPWLCIRREA